MMLVYILSAYLWCNFSSTRLLVMVKSWEGWFPGIMTKIAMHYYHFRPSVSAQTVGMTKIAFKRTKWAIIWGSTDYFRVRYQLTLWKRTWWVRLTTSRPSYPWSNLAIIPTSIHAFRYLGRLLSLLFYPEKCWYPQFWTANICFDVPGTATVNLLLL